MERAQRNRRAVTECKNSSALSLIDDDDEKATSGLSPIDLLALASATWPSQEVLTQKRLN